MGSSGEGAGQYGVYWDDLFGAVNWAIGWWLVSETSC